MVGALHKRPALRGIVDVRDDENTGVSKRLPENHNEGSNCVSVMEIHVGDVLL
jgi:hypothetical protein